MANMLKVKALLAKILNCMPTSSGVTVSAGSGLNVENVNITRMGNYVTGSLRARSTGSHSANAWVKIATVSAHPKAHAYFPAMIYDRSGTGANHYLDTELWANTSGELQVYPGVAVVDNDIVYVSFSFMAN